MSRSRPAPSAPDHGASDQGAPTDAPRRGPEGYNPYRTAAYAAALSDAGEPLQVAPWGSWVLRRVITGGARCDAAGLYPLLAFAEDADLMAGRTALEAAGLVSLVAVVDPFAAPPPEALARACELCRPFKRHAVIDRRLGPPDPSPHHRYKIRRARRRCSVEAVVLRDHLERWIALYDELVVHRSIAGVQRFSRSYFEQLAAMPDIGCFAARRDGAIIAMSIWLRSDRIAYYHLGASSADGYRVGASYALHAAAIDTYANSDVINLGGGAGLVEGDDGLVRFKRGFANADVTALLCGMILDRAAYGALAGDRAAGGYFPAYRAPPEPAAGAS